MCDQQNLVTTNIFKGKTYLIKMNTLNGNVLKLIVTDKYTGEDWQCAYDAAYIENLTHKTGNYKQFDVFAAMLRSGLLQTSGSVTLDLLTYEDLEEIRSHRDCGQTTRTFRSIDVGGSTLNSNRRYLILNYTVEFDRIFYPISLDYCGPPDPQVLQATIRMLEGEVTKLEQQLNKNRNKPNNHDARNVVLLENRIMELERENESLRSQLVNETRKRKQSSSSRQVEGLQQSVSELQHQIESQRVHFQRLIREIINEKTELEVDYWKSKEKRVEYVEDDNLWEIIHDTCPEKVDILFPKQSCSWQSSSQGMIGKTKVPLGSVEVKGEPSGPGDKDRSHKSHVQHFCSEHLKGTVRSSSLPTTVPTSGQPRGLVKFKIKRYADKRRPQRCRGKKEKSSSDSTVCGHVTSDGRSGISDLEYQIKALQDALKKNVLD